MMYVYKITNLVNGKVYIGQHSWSGEGLDPNYLCSSNNRHFWNAVDKYGIENFQKEIIEIADDKQTLDERETYWIQQYFGDNCYNLNPQGGSSFPPSCYTSELQSERGKKGAAKIKELGVGIYGMTHEECVINGKKGAEACRAKNAGIFALTSDQHSEIGKKYGGLSSGGKVCKEHGTGIFGMTTEERSEAGKKGAARLKELGVGIFGMTEEERAIAIEHAHEVQKERGTGFYGMTIEEHSEAGKKGAVVCKEKGVNCFFNKDLQSEAGKKGGGLNAINKVGYCGLSLEERQAAGKKGASISNVEYVWYLEDSNKIVYIGRSASAHVQMKKCNQLWRQGEIATDQQIELYKASQIDPQSKHRAIGPDGKVHMYTQEEIDVQDLQPAPSRSTKGKSGQ